jgi:hypothetical protein
MLLISKNHRQVAVSQQNMFSWKIFLQSAQQSDFNPKLSDLIRVP